MVGLVSAIECSEADYDGDGDVDFMDVFQLRQCINISVSEVAAVNCSFFDYDGSGMVEENDLVKYREWNAKTCPVEIIKVCSDSDMGINIYEKGIMKASEDGQNYESEDRCLEVPYNEIVLEEHYCFTEDEINRGAVLQIKCENGCEDGACVGSGSLVSECVDSDGMDYSSKGLVKGPKFTGKEKDLVEAGEYEDTCYNKGENNIIEYFCRNGLVVSESYKCANGCSDGLCMVKSNTTVISEGGMDSCLDVSTNYWDQETDACYSGYSENAISGLCSDPDGGKKIYEYAHTYGFRSYSSAEDPSRDLRIRTGGSDGCTSDKQLVEHYCSEEGYIQTEYIDCANGCSNGVCIKGDPVREQITCIFENSDEEQECYLAGQFGPADEGTKFCRGVEKCDIKFSDYEGEEITWKSTCGSYQYTKQDGEDEKIEFDCKTGETTPGEIENRGFRFASWECYDGEGQKSEDKTSCKPSELWQKYAKDFCEDSCYEDGSKCGVNSFSVWNECYLGFEDFLVIEEATETEIEKGIGLICKDSCPLEGKCYPFGYRKEGEYCSDEGGFVGQRSGDTSCDNNFECSSNVCVDDGCVSAGLMRRILNWFRRLFGG